MNKEQDRIVRRIEMDYRLVSNESRGKQWW